MSENASRKHSHLLVILRQVLIGLGAAVAAVVFYVAIVMGQPEESPVDQRRNQPPLQASEPQSITELSQLEGLVRSFPIPALLAASGSGYTVQGAVAFDKPFENGVGRILRLIYRTQDGTSLQVDSIAPARALNLMDSGKFRLSGTAGHSVAGQHTVRMENSGYIRLHMQTDDGLYAITIPKQAQEQIAGLVRPLQIYHLD